MLGVVAALYHIGEFGLKVVCREHSKCSCYVMRKPGESVEVVVVGLLEWVAEGCAGRRLSADQHLHTAEEFRPAMYTAIYQTSFRRNQMFVKSFKRNLADVLSY